MAKQLTHLDEQGKAKMVDVGGKPVSVREATAEGFIHLSRETVAAIADSKVPKGDVFAAARIAGIMAAKKCGELIPLCHPLPIESVEVAFDIPELEPDGNERVPLRIRSTARITAKTGIEMEALTAVTVAALTIYDMCKALDKAMSIERVRLVSKSKQPLL